jgi:flagellar biogenesis protein FliO
VKLCRTLKQYVKPVLKQRRDRKLELLEVQQLGEKRFLAIVRVDKQQYLIGGGAASVLLLAELGPGANRVLSPRPFSQERA